jgi:hypothetical protein
LHGAHNFLEKEDVAVMFDRPLCISCMGGRNFFRLNDHQARTLAADETLSRETRGRGTME